MSQWIKCSERTPEGYEDVIASDGYDCKCAFWDAEDKYWIYLGDTLVDEPTHWIPLPQPPKDE